MKNKLFVLFLLAHSFFGYLFSAHDQFNKELYLKTVQDLIQGKVPQIDGPDLQPLFINSSLPEIKFSSDLKLMIDEEKRQPTFLHAFVKLAANQDLKRILPLNDKKSAKSSTESEKYSRQFLFDFINTYFYLFYKTEVPLANGEERLFDSLYVSFLDTYISRNKSSSSLIATLVTEQFIQSPKHFLQLMIPRLKSIHFTEFERIIYPNFLMKDNAFVIKNDSNPRFQTYISLLFDLSDLIFSNSEKECIKNDHLISILILLSLSKYKYNQAISRASSDSVEQRYLEKTERAYYQFCEKLRNTKFAEKIYSFQLKENSDTDISLISESVNYLLDFNSELPLALFELCFSEKIAEEKAKKKLKKEKAEEAEKQQKEERKKEKLLEQKKKQATANENFKKLLETIREIANKAIFEMFKAPEERAEDKEPKYASYSSVPWFSFFYILLNNLRTAFFK